MNFFVIPTAYIQHLLTSAMVAISTLVAVSTQAEVVYSEFTNIPSNHSVSETANQLESIINQKGLTLFNRIDHADNAKKVNMDIRPSEVVIFGNPKLGTKLMQCEEKIALDLPLKMHIWEDEFGAVWLTYLKPDSLQSRYQVKDCDVFFNKMANVLPKLAELASK